MLVGEAITSGVPVPAAVPPQLPVYHANVVPDPPLAVSEIVPASSAQKLLRSTLADVGATASAFTVTLVLAESSHPLEFVTVSVYVPAIAVVALVDTVGLIALDV